MIHPVDLEDVNTLAIADTKEEAIARALQMHRWNNQSEPTPTFMILRDRAPVWFGHLVRETIFERLAYKKYCK